MKSWSGEWGTIPKLRRQWKIIFTGVGTSLTLSQQTTTGEEHEVLMIAKQPMGRLQIRLTTIPPDQVPRVVEHWATVAWPLNQNQNGVNKIVINHKRVKNNGYQLAFSVGDLGPIRLNVTGHQILRNLSGIKIRTSGESERNFMGEYGRHTERYRPGELVVLDKS